MDLVYIRSSFWLIVAFHAEVAHLAPCACFTARLIMFQGQCVFQCMVNRVSGIAYVSVLGYLCFRDCACFSAWLIVF